MATTPGPTTSATMAPPMWRRLFHMGAGSSIPFLAIFVGADVMVVLMATLLGLAVLVEGARLRYPDLNAVMVRRLRPLLKETEARRLTGATYIAFSSLVCFLVFDESVAIVALFFLALGDPVAAIVGSRVQGVRIWGKSPVGSVAFFVIALASAGALHGAGQVSWHGGLAVGAAVAALVELTPLFIDDNVTIPLAGGAAMMAMGV